MKQQTFEKKHAAEWEEFRRLLHQGVKYAHNNSGINTHKFAVMYKNICRHYALARNRGYTTHLTSDLHEMVMEGHQSLYKRKRFSWLSLIEFIIYDFPCAVRREFKYFFLAMLLFCVPLFASGILVYNTPDLIYSFQSPSEVASYEKMYDPKARKIGRERGSDTDVYMFGFYIRNNTGIGLQTFAGGIFFGLGAIVALVFNGLGIGATAGYLSHLGYFDTFYPFVVGHGSFELTAIVLAGCTGLKLGVSTLIPGNKTRLLSLKDTALEVIPIVYGMAAMFIIAAFIEAFWSSSASLPIPIKYVVGGFLWFVVIMYFSFCGRSGGNR